MKIPTFTSALAPTIRILVETRQALGYHDRAVVARLVHFDRYLTAHGWTQPYLTRPIVEDWVASDPTLQPHSRAARWHVMRLLGRFLAETHPQTYVPGPAWTEVPTPIFRPHIYRLAEIHQLLAEARRLTPVGSLRPHTYVTLLGLLYGTGLRISEALALRRNEVDLEAGILSIHESKFHKSRAVPLAPSVGQAVRHYQAECAARAYPADPDTPLFLNERHRGCTYDVVHATFLTIARGAGVRGPAGTPGPRLHDVRHTFAVHRLLAWYRDGGNVQARLPLLTDYLGHVSLVSTQVYLEITAELLHEAAQRFQPPHMDQTHPTGGTP